MSVLAFSAGNASVEHSAVVEQDAYVSVNVPDRQLSKQSLQIATHQNKSYVNWSPDERSATFHYLQKTAAVWKKNNIADQFLVYGKQYLKGDAGYHWEIVPYQTSSTWVGRIWQQFLVLWRVVFGGVAQPENQKQKQLEEYQNSFGKVAPSFRDTAKKVEEVIAGNDPFCDPDVITKQRVLEGRTVNVLYNYAPIGFGGERLHFLVVPKAHKPRFTDLSKEEYLEATNKVQKLITHFSEKRSIQEAYLFHKTGKDAGQTVPHWHMHLILTSSKTQDFLGKLTILKNMLFGSTPMKETALKQRVSQLRSELMTVEK